MDYIKNLEKSKSVCLASGRVIYDTNNREDNFIIYEHNNAFSELFKISSKTKSDISGVKLFKDNIDNYKNLIEMIYECAGNNCDNNGVIIFSDTQKEYTIYINSERTGYFTLLILKNKSIARDRQANFTENMFRYLAENMSDVLWATDLELNMLYVSSSIYKLTGYSPEEFMKTRLEDRHSIDSVKHILDKRKIVLEKYQNLCFEGYLILETEWKRKDGTTVWTEMNVTIIKDSDGKITGFQGTARDITERKKAQHALIASENRFRQIFDTVSGVAVQGYDKDLNVIYWNSASEKLYDYSKEHAIGKKLYDLIIPEEIKEAVISDIENWLNHGKVIQNGEIVLRKADNSKVSVFSSHCLLENIYGQKELYCIDIDLSEQNRILDRLRESEEMFRLIAENTSDGLMVLEDEKVIYASPSYLKILGYSDTEQKSHTVKDIYSLIHPDDAETLFASIYKAIDQKMPSLEYTYRVRHKQGHYIWREDNTKFIYGENSEMVRAYVIARDITDRVMKQDRLIKLSQAVEQSPSCVVITDLNGDIEYVNRKFYDLTGYYYTEVIGENPRFLKSGAHDSQFYKHLWETISSGKIWSGEFHNKKKNGTIYLESATISPVFDEKGNIINYLALKEDITELKNKESELIKSKKRYAFITEKVNDLIFIYKYHPNPGFVYVSPTSINITGYTPEEHYSDPFLARKLLSEEDLEKLNNYVASDSEDPIVIKWKRKDGEYIWTEQRLTREYNHKGDLIMIQGVARDITKEKKAEIIKEKLQAQLNQAQKMEAVGRLASGISHDFNNMLGVIIGNLELLFLDLDESSEMFKPLSDMKTAAEKSKNLTRQLLAFARKQTISPKTVNLNTVIEDMLKMLKRLISENIALKWQPYDNLWNVNVDISQIDQIMANLCVNAKDAIKETGEIVISTENLVVDEELCRKHNGLKSGEYVKISVCDTGSGIEETDIPHLFEPFFTTKAQGKGTGLGLATVYGIVKQNNGYINLNSKVGEGTCFHILLPRHKDTAVAEVFKHTKPEVQKGDEVILLVEDEPVILDIFTKMINNLGYNVIPTNSPSEAIDIARNSKTQIDLLITDVVMPEMSGKTLHDNIKNIFKDIKTIFVSGYTTDVIMDYNISVKDVDFIQKPFSIKEISLLIRKVLDR